MYCEPITHKYFISYIVITNLEKDEKIHFLKNAENIQAGLLPAASPADRPHLSLEVPPPLSGHYLPTPMTSCTIFIIPHIGWRLGYIELFFIGQSITDSSVYPIHWDSIRIIAFFI